MTDPWLVQNSAQQNNSVENGTRGNGVHQQQGEEKFEQAPLEFEDNFAPTPEKNRSDKPSTSAKIDGNNSSTHCLEPLPDSDNYLRGLERKLQKIKKGANLVEALTEKRNDCLRHLLNSGDADNNNEVLALDQPLNNIEFYRHLQPVQALSVGELVHIVKHDQLQQDQAQNTSDQHQELDEEDKKELK
ncbi:PREDICTED: uncharacterized protein LOC108968673 [Bactrocera latifrons]|uniref:Uncharacterized protein n=1 Tax=Bactrocera latifrons TaxID=174628 RepID=A0A0K8V0N1_BACLA|nr:PREDICTED: uncharacterized protein LOC108968673 [Bactrocera latifrons]